MRALLSVADRDGLSTFARGLIDLGVEIYATDGTREHLAADAIEVGSVADLTDVPALLGGQVKTFHPAIYAGILARRDKPEQLDELAAHDIGLIDIVVVNIKPFAVEIGARMVAIDEAIEMIDVGGAALLGAAARNAAGVTAVADPRHYPTVIAELRERGLVSAETRARLAAEAFSIVAAYHAEIAAYLNQLSGSLFPPRLAIVLEKATELRHGENPHQEAAFYRETTHRSGTLADAASYGGGSPSFNDLLDLDAAYRMAMDFAHPTVAIVRHTDPVGIATHADLVEAYRHAVATDPVAAFGGILGINRIVDGPTAREIADASYEAVVAPGFSDAALANLHGKADLQLLAVPADPADGLRDYGIASLDFHRVAGGLLVETRDRLMMDSGQLSVVTRRRPTLEELNDLLFAWRAVGHVRSNAIVLARNATTVGIGAAQTSRGTAVEIALRKAGDRARLAVLASDAYFPFPDVIGQAAVAGVTAIITPGGSQRDEMAIEVADRHHLAMVFTGRRHFRH
ncbi:MAG TPA: bifunctional phosphoribosylaminoimidazolecarboxamide formyltransferase/IMP cyclohydrolase [Candidatus Limnocylindrales bacterium]|nr:bifunctional phosphoribosylaminoimidazolecarboxamide formyltransferase/IMP cyclohydrolase [Candidatus Limnocylindrales bacterium]